MSSPLKKEVLKMQKKFFLETQIILVPKYLSHSNLENAYQHLMFLSQIRKLWAFEVLKWNALSELKSQR